ncbi:MAG: STAS domain-containing protein [Melioribacteraceae bacterium]|nr:STAS domain-containing protein [Melioribacteraceae bacterium]MCF8412092.1 STAS domain-containing protein [Melioribacteraceae bacterium]MCF8432342.1 STAS domain-containing protein [Melioribacteraceae bacterium]
MSITHEFSDNKKLLKLSADALDNTNITLLEKYLSVKLQNSDMPFALDFSEIKNISSTGIRFLSRIKKYEGIHFVGINSAVRPMFKLSQNEDYIQLICNVVEKWRIN